MSENSIYITTNDNQYHKANDKELTISYDVTTSAGYLNLDFERKSILEKYLDETTTSRYYYSQSPIDASGNIGIYSACYTSVNGNSTLQDLNSSDMYKYMRGLDNNNQKLKAKIAYYTALGRERESGFKIYNDELITQVVIIYDGNGAVNEDGSIPDPPEPQLVKKRTAYTVQGRGDLKLYDSDTGEYKEFLGYSLKPNGSADLISEMSTDYATNSRTLYAQWKDAYYYVRYNLGLNSGDTLTKSDGATNFIPDNEGLKEVEKDEEQLYQIVPSIPVGNNVNLYSDSLIKTSGSNMYELIGWSKTNGGEVDYNLGEEYTDKTKITLYAVWGEITEIDNLYWNKYSQWTNAITLNNNGKTINMVGNRSYTGLNCMWAKLNNPIRKVKFDYKISFQHSYISAGIMFITNDINSKDSSGKINGSISGYAINFTNGGSSSLCSFSSFPYLISIPVTNGNNELTLNKDQFLLSSVKSMPLDYGYKSYYVSDAKEITISYNNGIILIDGVYNGNSISYTYDIGNPNLKIYSIGFYSTHQSHSCGKIGYFNLDNIKVITKN